ncbi:MAG TPA: membrane protein insertion efficiency factor YidD [Candidatus Cloacimonadota bacterium]|nr:membrane protein insertion efficiency factor YidD [Candidatus Cloacimonadota bacterium]HOD52948.1 membrane protein insertion efficiency factor YidD [Candidatus Cloacimonadota bacterium]HPM01883.1 membrane protein insertion efficiency factor YidD [Candidatus Cloacimonadota bacterium]
MRLVNYPFYVIIRFYQKIISPVIPPSCRFTPTCSEYARQAFMKYPLHKALFLSLKRILKCHPFHPGGHDPLP